MYFKGGTTNGLLASVYGLASFICLFLAMNQHSTMKTVSYVVGVLAVILAAYWLATREVSGIPFLLLGGIQIALGARAEHVALQIGSGALAVIGFVAGLMMFAAVKKYFDQCDCLIMAAAVSDYAPSRPAKTKIKKSSKNLTIVLKPTPDILKWAAGKSKGRQVVVGFALEDNDPRTHAEAKLTRKGCDAIILNGPGNVGGDRGTIEILTADGRWSQPASGSKQNLARRIIRLVERLCGQRVRMPGDAL